MAPLQPIPNIYDVPHDVNLARNLPPERQLAQVQENFRSLSRNMMSSTLNTFVLVPIKGGLIVGNGTNFVVLPPRPNGQVLVTDDTKPDGLAYTDPITALNVYSDEERRLLEEMIINLYSMLDLIQSIGVRVDVNGSPIGTAQELNFIGGNGASVTVKPNGSRADITISGTTDFFTATNQTGVTILAGQSVNVTSSGVVLANNTDTTLPCRGLCVGGVPSGFIGTFQSKGPFTLADWTAVVGTALLSPGTYYIQDITAGRLTYTVPGSGPYQLVGQAINATTLDIAIKESIGL